MDEKENGYYESQQKFLMDENSRLIEALDKAVEKASNERNIEIAKNLISLKSENAFIVVATGLTIEQVEELRTK
ncbi:MAG: hypothetical protein EAZ27_10040 [Cytophagales bacterium]|nr:MAG: hypothetical protein EAZ27_10040 [Cytophagales bacterium]